MKALLFSGGKDSLLLLDMIKEPVTVIHFYERLHPEVEKLAVSVGFLSWPPATRYLIPWDDSVVLVSEYSFGHAYLPVLRDVRVKPGEPCYFEQTDRRTLRYFDYPFETTYWGYKKSDERHPCMGEAFPGEFDLGPTRMIGPLYDYTDEQVLAQLPEYQSFDDSISICADCLDSLKTWDREASLKAFAAKFGFRRAA